MENDIIAPQIILWWVVAVDLPLVTLLVTLVSRWRRDVLQEIDQMKMYLSEHKLEVARSYASINQLKDVESRLIAHLLRIETKLDHTALKAHALYTPQEKGENHVL